MAVLHSAIGVGLLDAAMAVLVFLVLRSGWKLKG
jgi:ABC-2 type transport system permease protein